LSKGGVLLRDVADAIKPLLTEYKGLGKFLGEIGIEDATGILRGNGLTANLKGLAVAQNTGQAGRVASYLGNIKGAYTQFIMKFDRLTDGWDVIQDLRHVNAAGYDMIIGKGGIVRLMEAKSGARVTLRQISNYLDKTSGTLIFNTDYFLNPIRGLIGNDAVMSAFRSGRLELEIFINNVNHAQIVSDLTSEIGVLTAKYVDDVGNLHDLKIIITGLIK